MVFFEFSQIETKDLIDIYHYWPQLARLRLPRYEYTPRELSSGAILYAYTNENNSTYRRIGEDELYGVEDYNNPLEFSAKASAYHLYFNYLRKNRYREDKSPVEVLRERFPVVDECLI